MPLYDDDDSPPPGKGSADITNEVSTSSDSSKEGSNTARNAPVVDLSARNRAPINMRRIQPVRALPITDCAPPSFLPKGAVDDSVPNLLVNYIVKNEYQPAVPNEYIVCKRKAEEREARERHAREVAERLSRDHKEEARKRQKGAAIAPPQALLEPPSPPKVRFFQFQSLLLFHSNFFRSRIHPPNSMPPPAFLPSFGKATSKGLGVAANIMSKFGYKHGGGLGRDEQGMSTALQLKTRRTWTLSVNGDQNMVVLRSDDDSIEHEIREEMAKYGQVASVVIHKLEGVSDDVAVRIFVEFTNVAQAIKAFVVMNGRFFRRSIGGCFILLRR
ncbi:g-patch domain protein [Ostertagia ostertagi]